MKIYIVTKLPAELNYDEEVEETVAFFSKQETAEAVSNGLNQLHDVYNNIGNTRDFWPTYEVREDEVIER